MKPSPSNRPRFLCRWVRQWSTAFGSPDAQPPRGLSSRHVETCSDCQEFFSVCDDLDAALKRDAAPYKQAAVSGLDQRIIRAVRMSEPPPRRSHVRAAALSFAGVAACATLAVVLFQRQTADQSAPTIAVDGSSVAVTEMLAAAGSFSDRMWNSLKPSAAAFAEKNPLEEELDLVYSDARSALGFLAMNFFPTELGGASEPETSDSAQRG